MSSPLVRAGKGVIKKPKMALLNAKYWQKGSNDYFSLYSKIVEMCYLE